jgi:hypothetical protein
MTNAQVLSSMEGKIISDYDWLLKTAVSSTCKTTSNIQEKDIVETNVHQCDFMSEFNMFPNPASNSLTIEFEASKSITKLIIVGMDGKSVYERTMEDFDGIFSETIILDAVKGMYIVSVVQNDDIFIKKLFIQ